MVLSDALKCGAAQWESRSAQSASAANRRAAFDERACAMTRGHSRRQACELIGFFAAAPSTATDCELTATAVAAISASRHDSRQEPSAVVPHVRICAGAQSSLRPYRARCAVSSALECGRLSSPRTRDSASASSRTAWVRRNPPARRQVARTLENSTGIEASPFQSAPRAYRACASRVRSPSISRQATTRVSTRTTPRCRSVAPGGNGRLGVLDHDRPAGPKAHRFRRAPCLQ